MTLPDESETPIEEKKLFRQVIAALIATSCNLSTGTAMAYSAILLPQLENSTSKVILHENAKSWIASIYSLVGILGSTLGGILMAKYGRIFTLKSASILNLSSWATIALSPNVYCLIFGRVLSGLSTVQLMNAGVVYVTEIGRKDVRGVYASFGSIFLSLGLLLTYLQGWFLHWRATAWLNFGYQLIPFCLLFFIPESPSWLISRNQLDKAKQSVNWLYNKEKTTNEEKSFVDVKFDNLVIEEKSKSAAGIKITNVIQTFLKPNGYKPLLILSGLFFIQQFSGIYVILFYSVDFCKATGTNIDPYLASILIGLLRFVTSFLITWVLKKVNRRPILIFTTIGMGISMLLSGFFTKWIISGSTTMQFAPVLFLIIYMLFSVFGLITVPITMTAELFPMKIRALAQGTVVCFASLMMFVVLQSYYFMEQHLGGLTGVQWFFSGVSFLGVIYIYIFLPETQNKSLNEIEDYFIPNYLRSKKSRFSNKKQTENDVLIIKHI